MNKRLRLKLEQAVFNAYWKVFNAAPKDTWNLAVNALKLEETETGYVIYVDSAVAPYMVYTEEPWTSTRWNGKKNPNEGWFRRVADEVTVELAAALGGKIEVNYGGVE